MVLYRKYRPQTLQDLIGQELVKESLGSAFQSGKLAHAYLFCGPRGCGKTSTARILAKMVNCENQETGNLPCNSCLTCVSITDGTNMDTIEIDGASNRGIEDIRQLRENIKLATTGAKKKVYIIDEVHMLTGEAFNALLKTLEEPPSHVLFILATTEPQKIPQTILSRVQRLDFKLASPDELISALKKVAEAENITIQEEAFLIIAKKAAGSFRDAIKFLDQLSSEPAITKQLAEEKLGSGSMAEVIKLVEFLIKGNVEEALGVLQRQSDMGVAPKELNTTILDVLRQLLLIKNNLGERFVKKELDDEQYQQLNGVAPLVTLEKVVTIIDHFQKSFEQLRFVSIPTLPLEVAIVESTLVGNLELGVGSKATNEIAVEVQSKEKASASPDSPNSQPQTPSSSDIHKLQEKWVYVLETVRQYNFSLEALLRSAGIIECEGGNVVMEVPYSFHQRIMEAPKSRDLLESIFSDILGRTIKVFTVLAKRKHKSEEVVNVDVAADDEIVKLATEIFNSDSAT